VINTTFSYDAKGNMTSGNGLSVTYTPFNKPSTITRGTASVSFDHDPEHQRYAQTSLSGVTLYIAGGGVLAERFAGTGGIVRWTNYLMVGGRYIGIHVENSDETTATRYFHTDHLGSIAVITNEAGAVVERLSYDAWGLRRHPDGTPDPSGSISSQSSRGFTGHEHLADVGLIHMNGRVYDPLLARFGTPDPMTEDPFSTQGWNRYSYVGNSPVNFTDPSGYCFLGCFWKPIFKAIGNFFKENWRAILQITVTALCNLTPLAGPGCAAIGSFVSGITSGDLGMAIRGAAIAFFTAAAFDAVGTATLGPKHTLPAFLSPAHLANMAGHALVGCASAVAQGGKCGPGALSAAAGSFAGPLLKGLNFTQGLVAHAVVGGVASVAAGGNFANGAVTAAFGYLFNQAAPKDAKPWGANQASDPNGQYALAARDGELWTWQVPEGSPEVEGNEIPGDTPFKGNVDGWDAVYAPPKTRAIFMFMDANGNALPDGQGLKFVDPLDDNGLLMLRSPTYESPNPTPPRVIYVYPKAPIELPGKK
jgi:RHS repeat-associated protein